MRDLIISILLFLLFFILIPALINGLIEKKREIFGFGLILESRVNDSSGDFRGMCRPVWLNNNGVCFRFNGGPTGFFRRYDEGKWHLTGKEFHGIILGGKVFSTERKGNLI